MAQQRFIGKYEGKEREIDLEPLGDGKYAVWLNQKRHEVDAHQAAGGSWSVIIDGQSYDIELEVGSEHESEGRYNCLIRGRVVNLTVEDERRIRMAAGIRKLKVEGPQVITAPMPGKIIKILVQAGAPVTDGQALVIVEAMKMENEIRAPTGGRIARIWVEAGQAVEANAKLIAIE